MMSAPQKKTTKPIRRRSQVNQQENQVNQVNQESQDESQGEPNVTSRASQRGAYRRLALTALGPALIAAAVGLVAAYLGRFLLPGVIMTTPAEQFGDQFTSLIPLQIFAFLLNTFDGNAKHIYVGGVVVVEALLTAVFGVAYVLGRQALRQRQGWTPQASAGRRRGKGRRTPQSPLARFVKATTRAEQPGYVEAALIVLGLWVVSAGIVAPLIGGGFFGAKLYGGAGAVFLAQVIPNSIFALLYIALLHNVQATAEARANAAPAGASAAATNALPRRALIRQGILAAVILGGGALIWEALSSGLGTALGLGGPHRPPLTISQQPTRIIPPPKPVYGAWTPVAGQTPELTSPNDFYYVSKNLVSDPTINAANWSLTIDGQVEHPYTLSYAQLQALPSTDQYHTLECISNEVGGNLMSNGFFTGVSLADLLNKAGVKQGATQLIFYGADDYSDRLHLSQALDPSSLVVYHLDGAPLPQPHGYPARLLIPGLYGMKNGKWLVRLEVATGDYQGYWEQRGWTPESHVKMTSRIDTPHDGDFLTAKPTYISGVAYSGANGIARVDVTLDGGRTWTPTTLRRPLGALTWTLWEYRWTPTTGTYTLGVRAIDLDGNVQTIVEAPTLPDGASGYDAISVTVR